MFKSKIKAIYLFVTMVCMLLLFGVTAKAADNQTVYGDLGSWTASDGTVWLYAEKGTDEAAVYGVRNAMLELEIPSYVYDENGRGREVTAAIGSGEANNSQYATTPFIYAGRDEEYVPYSLSFPDTVSYIGTCAFSGAKFTREDSPWEFLAGIVLPQNPLLVIEEKGFYKCLNLQKVVFRAGIIKAQPVEIESLAFACCPKLTEMSFPDNSTVASDVLAYCANLKEIINAPATVDMGDEECSLEKISYACGVETIGGLYLYNNETDSTLKTVTLPEGVNKIDYGAFQNCTALTAINLPEGLKEIEPDAFEGCVSLNSFTALPSSLEQIGDRAFMGCKNLHLSVTYPATDSACLYDFKDSGITDISFHGNMRTIYEGAFTGCGELRSIQVESGSGGFYSVDGVLYVKNYRRKGNVTEEVPGIMIYPAGKSYAGSYTVPGDARTLGSSAFDSCKFTSIRIPATVEVIFEAPRETLTGPYVYYSSFDNMASDCSLYVVKNSYADIEMPVKYMKQYMAGSPVKITYKLNGGANNVGNPQTFAGGNTICLKNPVRQGYKFAGWHVEDQEKYATGWWEDEETAKSQYTPARKELMKGVTFVAEWTADKPASGTGKQPVAGNTAEKTISGAIYKLNADGTAEYAAPSNAASKTSVKVPDKVKSGGKAYKVTKISKKAFAKCKKLKSVEIGKNVKEIGPQAFSGCKKLKKITVQSKKLKKVGKQAFKGIGKKAKIKVPKAKLNAYKKLLKGKGQAKSVKITK